MWLLITKPRMQWRSQEFSMEGYGGGLVADPPAAGGHWDLWRSPQQRWAIFAIFQ